MSVIYKGAKSFEGYLQLYAYSLDKQAPMFIFFFVFLLLQIFYLYYIIRIVGYSKY